MLQFKKSKGAITLIDWEAIKTEYLTTDTSYRKLANKYKVNATTICKRAKSENWITQKANKSKQKQTELTEMASEQITDDFEKLISLNERLIGLAEQKVKGYEMLAKIDNDKKEANFVLVDVKSLKGLVDMVSGLTANIRNLKGLPTYNEREAQQIARKRLEIEEKKAEIDTGDKEIKIVFEGDVGDLKEYGD